MTVRVGPEGADAFRLEVEDSGIGVRQEHLGRLFTEFGRPKEANLRAVLAAINDKNGRLRCHYQTRISRIARNAEARRPLTVTLQTATGEESCECNRVIARLGADPPRRFVEAIGVKFPSERRALRYPAAPELIADHARRLLRISAKA